MEDQKEAEFTGWMILGRVSCYSITICRDCQGSFPDKIRLTKNAANCLSNLKTIAESEEKTLNEIEKILISHFTDTLGRPPKMAKYILRS